MVDVREMVLGQGRCRCWAGRVCGCLAVGFVLFAGQAWCAPAAGDVALPVSTPVPGSMPLPGSAPVPGSAGPAGSAVATGPAGSADAGASAGPVGLPVATGSMGSAVAAQPGNAFAGMAQFLENQRTFFVELNSTTTIRSGGNERQSGGISRVWYRRPDHVVWTTESDVGASAMAIDGAQWTLYLPSLSKYMVAPLQGGVDTHLASMSAPYGIIASSLFSSSPSASLTGALVGTPTVAGEGQVLGVDCVHLVLPTYSGDTHLWVAKGMIPLPVKLVYDMSIPASPGEDNGVVSRTEVSFRWRVNVDLPDSTFELKIPATAQRTDRLGAPVVTAKLRAKDDGGDSGRKGSSRGRSSSSSGSSRSQSSGSGRTADNKPLGLAFDPPPNVDGPLAMRSALDGTEHSSLPSLQAGSQDIVRQAINSAKPDAVPSGASYQPAQQRQAPPPASSASQSPSFALTLLDGQTVNLGAYRGNKVVVLDFWATWCGPCRQSMPVVSQVAQNYRSRGVEFFAVNMAENEGEIRRFLQQQGIQLPVAKDPSGALAAAFGVTGIPHLVVIGKDGTVKATHTGADRNLAEKLMRDLNQALQ